MKLFELKSTREWKWETTTPDKVVASFTTEPKPSEQDPNPKPIKYYVEFVKETVTKAFRYDQATLEKLQSSGLTTSWEIMFFFRGELGYREIQVSRTRGEMQVFASVLEIINAFITMVEPKSFHFSGDEAEPSRLRLYTNMLGRFRRQGWNVAQSYIPSNGVEIYIAYKP